MLGGGIKQVAPSEVDEADTLVWEPLLDLESGSALMDEPDIATVTFFKVAGEAEAAQVIAGFRERVASICSANPWLTGRILRDRSRHKNVILEFQTQVTSAQVDNVFEESQAPELTDLTGREDPGCIMDKVTASPARIGTGRRILRSKNNKVVKFTVAKCTSDPTVLAVVVSLTHLVGDGHTYYSILSMIDVNVPIVALKPKRKEEILKGVGNLVGHKEQAHMTSPGLIMNAVLSMVFSKKAKRFMCTVDMEKIAAAKESVSSGFISTNDIITSTFGKAVKARLMMMNINTRNKLEGLSSEDAGNYQAVVFYDPEGYETPERIRASLCGPTLKRKSNQALPGFFEASRSRYCAVSNWIFPCFNAELQLHTAIQTPVSLHIPVCTPSLPWHVAISFRPRPNTTAVLYFLPSASVEDLVAAGAPIGEKINENGPLANAPPR